MNCRILLIFVFAFATQRCYSQDSVNIPSILKSYFSGIESKASKYSKRVDHTTIKTLRKLARLETRIYRLLKISNPTAFQKLTSPGTVSFHDLYNQYGRESQQIRSSYDGYRDRVSTSLKYIRTISDSSEAERANTTLDKLDELNGKVSEAESLERLIRERKSALVSEALRVAGSKKYLHKINKEAFYYAETLANYKSIFSEPGKAEALVTKLLGNIPEFHAFSARNSSLAGFFPQNGAASAATGLQTRLQVNDILTERLSDQGSALQIVQAGIVAANSELLKLKAGFSGLSNNGEGELPSFKPNPQKSKTFGQRLVYETTLQFGKRRNFLPGSADLGIGIGYKFSRLGEAGLGFTYKAGLSFNRKVLLTHEGVGWRTYIDWKIRGGFYASGGYEANHFKAFRRFSDLDEWQRSGLVGLSKKIPFSKGVIKGLNLRLYYDLLHNSHTPVSEAFIFRIGYKMGK